MTERERLPKDGTDTTAHTLVERIEEELREPIVEGRKEDLPAEAAEKINWPVVIGFVAVFGVAAAIIYGLLIFWSST